MFLLELLSPRFTLEMPTIVGVGKGPRPGAGKSIPGLPESWAVTAASLDLLEKARVRARSQTPNPVTPIWEARDPDRTNHAP